MAKVITFEFTDYEGAAPSPDDKIYAIPFELKAGKIGTVKVADTFPVPHIVGLQVCSEIFGVQAQPSVVRANYVEVRVLSKKRDAKGTVYITLRDGTKALRSSVMKSDASPSTGY